MKSLGEKYGTYAKNLVNYQIKIQDLPKIRRIL